MGRRLTNFGERLRGVDSVGVAVNTVLAPWRPRVNVLKAM